MKKNFGFKAKRQRAISMLRAGYTVDEIVMMLSLPERIVRKFAKCA